MKIALVCPKYYPRVGGVEKVVKEMAERLSRKSYETYVISADGAQDISRERINGVNVVRFKSLHPSNSYFFAPAIKEFVEESNFNIVHAHNYHAFPALFASMAEGDHRFIFNPHYHGAGHSFVRNILHNPYKPIGRKIFERADKVVCVSRTEKELIKRNFGVKEERIEIIPNGVDLDRIEKSTPFEQDDKVVLFVGRLEKYKNIQLLIKAMAHLPNLKLKIIGTGEYEPKLLNLIKKLELRERIEILRNLTDDEVYRWMKTCSVFVNLSDYEAFGMTVIEALAAGKHAIVNKRSGLEEIAQVFRNCITPISISETNSIQLAHVIESSLNAQTKYNLKILDWEEIFIRICTLYETHEKYNDRIMPLSGGRNE